MRVAWALALLFVTPCAMAGSPEHPELRDPPDDTYTVGVSQVVGGDILRAWFHDDGPESLRLTLQLKDLPARPEARFDVYWQVLPHLYAHQPPAYLARASFETGTPTYELLSLERGATARLGELQGSFSPGSPGTITWTIPYDAIGAAPLHLLRGPGAAVDVLTPAVGLVPGARHANRTDLAPFASSWFQLRLADLLTAPEPPDRAPDLTDEVGAETDAIYQNTDLEALWLELDDTGLRATLQLRALEPHQLPKCEILYRLHLMDIEASAAIETLLRVRGGPNGTQGVEYIDVDANVGTRAPEERNDTTFVRVGRPGYLHVRLPHADWPATDALHLRFSAYSQAFCNDRIVSDQFSNWAEPDELFGLPAPPAAWLLLAAAAACLLARRRRT